MQGRTFHPWRCAFALRLMFGLGMCWLAETSSADPWPWGEQFYGAKFPVYLEAHNSCESTETIQIKPVSLPYLTMQGSVTVPGKGKVVVSGMVQLPPEPSPPLRTGLPGEPGWGHVPVPPFFVPPGQMPPPSIHQPNFADITGSVELNFDGNKHCDPSHVVYVASGHMHFRPPEPDKGPEQIHKTDVCQVYWNIGEPPAQLGDEDCTLKMRGYAAAFVERVLAPYTQNDPDSWLWLSAIDISSSSIDQLLLMKARASAQTGNPGSGDKAAGEYAARWQEHKPAENHCASAWEVSGGELADDCLASVRTATMALARQVDAESKSEEQIKHMSGPELANYKDDLRNRLASRAPVDIQPPESDDCRRAWTSPGYLAKGVAGECAPALREVASKWRASVAPLVATHPGELGWMPSQEKIQTMGSNELLMIKAQVDGVQRRLAK